jgi:hypothetical protein
MARCSSRNGPRFSRISGTVMRHSRRLDATKGSSPSAFPHLAAETLTLYHRGRRTVVVGQHEVLGVVIGGASGAGEHTALRVPTGRVAAGHRRCVQPHCVSALGGVMRRKMVGIAMRTCERGTRGRDEPASREHGVRSHAQHADVCEFAALLSSRYRRLRYALRSSADDACATHTWTSGVRREAGSGTSKGEHARQGVKGRAHASQQRRQHRRLRIRLSRGRADAADGTAGRFLERWS